MNGNGKIRWLLLLFIDLQKAFDCILVYTSYFSSSFEIAGNKMNALDWRYCMDRVHIEELNSMMPETQRYRQYPNLQMYK